MSSGHSGTVQATGGIYISRPADDDLFLHCNNNNFCYLLAARQLGKSSLMVQTVEKLSRLGFQTVIIDLTLIGTLTSAEQWYLGLIDRIVSQLSLNIDYKFWWDSNSHLGITQRLTRFFEANIVNQFDTPTVIFVDEIDTTLSLGFTDDFFAAIRALYNARSQNSDFKKLSFVLIGVATPNELIQDPKRTPFNIGYRIDMNYFALNDAKQLVKAWSIPFEKSTQILEWVFEWTEGHPYLTQKLCSKLSQKPDLTSINKEIVARTVRETFISEHGWQDDNLRSIRDMLLKRVPNKQAVLMTYEQVAFGDKVVIDEETSIDKTYLKLSGILRRTRGGELIVSNKIYKDVFNHNWVRENIPTSWKQKVSKFPFRFRYPIRVSAFIRSLPVSVNGLKNFFWILLAFFLANVIFRLTWPALINSFERIKSLFTNLWQVLITITSQPAFNLLTFLIAFLSFIFMIIVVRRTSQQNPFIQRVTTRFAALDLRTKPYLGGAKVKAFLVVLEGDTNIGKSLEIFGDTTLGRSAQFADLLFQKRDENSPISRLHCAIIDDEDQFLIRDEDSANGTFLNGVRLTPLSLIQLHSGDQIELARVERGGVRLLFQLPDDIQSNQFFDMDASPPELYDGNQNDWLFDIATRHPKPPTLNDDEIGDRF